MSVEMTLMFPPSQAKFFHPQNVAYHPQLRLLFVADASNRSIKQIDEVRGIVTQLLKLDGGSLNYLLLEMALLIRLYSPTQLMLLLMMEEL